MPKLIKKILLLFLSSFLFLNSMLMPFTTVKAQGLTDQQNDIYNLWNHKWYSEMDYMSWYTKVYDPDTPESEIFGERYTAAQVQWVIYSVISNLLLNLIPGTPEILICKDGDINKCFEATRKYFEAITIVADSRTDKKLTLIDTIGRNPISGIGYLSHVVSKFKLIPEVSAQNAGFGYNTAGRSLIPIWSAMRNLSYGFIIIASVILSFMVMFQVKINPQTMVTVQSAIPRVIGAAVLITFSYAIAGFVIDIMYVFIGLVAMVISSSGLTQWPASSMFTSLTESSLIALLYYYWSTFTSAAWAIAKEGDQYGILMWILAVLSIFVVISTSVKILMMTVKNFALLVIAFFTGPVEIMLGIITQSSGFGTWIKKIIGYAVFYPILGLMLFLAYFFLYQGGSLATVDNTTPFFPTANFVSSSTWAPPLTALGVGSYTILWIAMSFVVFIEIPKVADMVQAFVSGKNWAFGTGINEVNTSLQNTFQKGAIDPAIKAAPGAIKTGASWVGSGIRYVAGRWL